MTINQYCKYKGIMCSLATEFGYCTVTACINKEVRNMEQKQFYKLEFIKNITEHESEIRILYADDFEVHKTESGTLFYICRFSDGPRKRSVRTSLMTIM